MKTDLHDLATSPAPAEASATLPRGGRPPFGYVRDGTSLAIDPKTAPIRRRIYELFVEHKRQHVVARILNERGYRTATGKKFSRQTVVRNIRDTTANGLYRTNYSRLTDDGIALKPAAEWIWQAVPPIVSNELWNEANAILDAQQTEHNHIGRPATHLFSGFVRCACGGAMYVPTRSLRYKCRKCANGIPAPDLEDIFLKELGDSLTPHWGNLSAKERRNIVELVIKTITVDAETIAIDFRYTPNVQKDALDMSALSHASARAASQNTRTKGT